MQVSPGELPSVPCSEPISEGIGVRWPTAPPCRQSLRGMVNPPRFTELSDPFVQMDWLKLRTAFAATSADQEAPEYLLTVRPDLKTRPRSPR